MKPTDANTTGVESYDHRELVRLPEYQAAREALDALVHALQQQGSEPTQAEWLAAVEQMAASLVYGDRCEVCRDRDQPYVVRWPVRAEVSTRHGEQWLDGEYLCPDCGHHWSVFWAVNVGVMV